MGTHIGFKRAFLNSFNSRINRKSSAPLSRLPLCKLFANIVPPPNTLNAPYFMSFPRGLELLRTLRGINITLITNKAQS